jgi:hypothetical protein
MIINVEVTEYVVYGGSQLPQMSVLSLFVNLFNIFRFGWGVAIAFEA